MMCHMKTSFRHLNLFKISHRKFIDKNKKNNESSEEVNEISEMKNVHNIGMNNIQENVIPISDNNNLPEYIKVYSMKMIDTKNLDFIPHNETINNEYYKYGLPVNNKQLQSYNSFLTEKEKDINETPMMNIINNFDLDKDSSYESLVLKYDEMYKNGKFNVIRT